MSMRRQRRGRNCLLLLLVLLFTTLNYRISIMKTTIRSTSPCWSSFIYTANAFGGIATSTINQNSYHNPYKKRHEQQLPNKSTLSLSYSLLTWNILAPSK